VSWKARHLYGQVFALNRVRDDGSEQELRANRRSLEREHERLLAKDDGGGAAAVTIGEKLAAIEAAQPAAQEGPQNAPQAADDSEPADE